MPTLLYQCPAGLSGDMNLGAMIALGVDPEKLKSELEKLPYEGWSIQFTDDERSGITGTRCDVKEGHTHSHAHAHSHSHSHSEGHHHHHRTFAEISDAINSSQLKDSVKADAIQCFRVLAEAEGSVHGIAPEAVHFHEVGAIDSIVDMVGAAICWDLLGVTRIAYSELELGGGTVQCAHGRMPVPAPATARLLEGMVVSTGATNKEATTPTGAALLVGKNASYQPKLSGQLIKVGTGIGQRKDPNLPNAVHVALIDEVSTITQLEQDTVWELVANLDDMSPESTGFLAEALRSAGALDVWQSPAFFKKGRSGTVVHALCAAAELETVEAAFFKHSSSLGVRRQSWQRSILPREIHNFASSLGAIRLKVATRPDGTSTCKIEYEDLAKLANEQDLPINRIEQTILHEWNVSRK